MVSLVSLCSPTFGNKFRLDVGSSADTAQVVQDSEVVCVVILHYTGLPHDLENSISKQ